MFFDERNCSSFDNDRDLVSGFNIQKRCGHVEEVFLEKGKSNQWYGRQIRHLSAQLCGECYNETKKISE